MKINWPGIYRYPDYKSMWPKHGLFIQKNKSVSSYIFVLRFPFTGWISISYVSNKIYCASINADLTEKYTDTGKRKRRVRFDAGLKSGK